MCACKIERSCENIISRSEKIYTAKETTAIANARASAKVESEYLIFINSTQIK